MGKIASFKDLYAWQQGHQLVISIYSLTKSFPQDEQYGLCSQMKRCSVSITSNIAEGFSRKSNNEKVQFYYISLGSLTELHNQLLIARDVGYIEDGIAQPLEEVILNTYNLVKGLIRGVDKLKN